MTRKFSAAKSLYNSSDATLVKAKALSGNVGGQKREQTVLTPDWLVDIVRAAFGGTIDLDPCASDETQLATVNVTKEMDGLSIPWTGCNVYSNPPYSDLKAWMDKYWREATGEAGIQARILALIPFRPQRKWFPKFTKGALVYSLSPFPFVGHKSAFPAPLCLVGYNVQDLSELLGSRCTGVWGVK